MSMPQNSNVRTTPEKVAKHDALTPLLEAMASDFEELTKKKPDATLNRRKVLMVNRLLKDIFLILDGETNREFLELLDEDDLPQNSDVLLLLHQTLAAMKMFSQKYHGYERDIGRFWLVDEPARSQKRTRITS